jgi:hypothetical protein
MLGEMEIRVASGTEEYMNPLGYLDKRFKK